MYTRFYGLIHNPFEMSPDPRFYCPTPCHNEALALLTYGVQARKGFIVISGEVGTGKTLLVRCLVDSLVRRGVSFAFVYNPALSVRGFLTHLLNDFGVPIHSGSKVRLLYALNEFLLNRSRHGETTALIVDEAQLLNWELLEEIRLLTNLETTQFKLLQIVLVGQPELEQRLDSHELRQLKQRVTMRCRLKALGFDEVGEYIRRRLQLAGADSTTTIFTDETISAVYKLSGGIPRIINTICENALIAGYSQQATQITPSIVQEVAADLRLEPTQSVPGQKVDGAAEGPRILTQMIAPWNSSGEHSLRDLKAESGS